MSHAGHQQPRRKTKTVSEDVLDAFEAAWLIGTHVETLRRMARRGQVPAYKVGKDWRFRREALDEWCETHHLRSGAALALVVDDEKSVRDTVRAFLEADGYRVHTATDGREAISSARRDMPDVVLLDLVMPGMSGVDVLKELHAMDPDVPVIMVTEYPDSESMKEALRHPPVILLPKPVEKAVLLSTVKRVLHGSAKTRRGSR